MRYHRPATFAEAVTIAAAGRGITRFLAGGTDVLVQLRAGIVTPDDLIDIKSIPGVDAVTRTEEGGWRIGIAVPGIVLRGHDGLRADWPGVVEGMNLVGSTQVQGRATLAGNLCNGSPAADSVPGLVAAGAQAEVTGPDGSRLMPVAAIPKGPGKTTLQPGEIVSAILLPPRGQGGGDAYQRFIPRSEMDIAVVGCAVNLRVAGDVITEASVALGAVAPTVIAVPDAAAAIIGTALDAATLDRLAAIASAAATPITDKRGTAAFRTHVAGVLARRVALSALARATGDRP